MDDTLIFVLLVTCFCLGALAHKYDAENTKLRAQLAAVPPPKACPKPADAVPAICAAWWFDKADVSDVRTLICQGAKK